MQENQYNPLDREQREYDQQRVAIYLGRVMGWMCVGLLTTLAVALLCLAIPQVAAVLYNSNVIYVIILVQLGLVLGMSAAMRRAGPTAVTVMFLGYAAMTGITFTGLFFLFELSSLVYVFGVAAAVFVAMSLYGLFAKKDLTRIGTIAFFGLIGIILAGVANLFFRSGTLNLAVTVVGILVFVILTAYDAQKIKAIYLDAVAQGYDEYGPELQKMAIYGALTLYLDFINLFLKLLRLLGRRRR